MYTKYFERDEGSLAYSEYGTSGDLVLMLPGMGALRSEYRFLAPALVGSGYHAVTVDLRGQGDSSVPWKTYDVPSVGNDILGLIDHLGSGPAHLVGTSFAPAAIVWAAVDHPDRVRSQVLINPFVRTVKVNPLMGAAIWLVMNNPWRVSTWAWYYNRMYPTRKPGDFDTYIQQLKRNISEKGRFDAVKKIGTSSRQPSMERLGRVAVPTLVVMGTRDPDFPDPVEEGKVVAAETKGSLALVEGAGHYPQAEMPEKTTPIILDFLNQAG